MTLYPTAEAPLFEFGLPTPLWMAWTFLSSLV